MIELLPKFDFTTVTLSNYSKMRTFTIQYASNLFVSQNSTWKQAQRLLTLGKAPNLALLGNIGNTQSHKTKDFVRWCSDNWEHVYCVPGPAELRSNDHLFGLFNNIPKNVTVLDNTAYHSEPNLLILGCPLWSGHGNKINDYTEWSDAEKYFFAYKPGNTIKNWHENDVEFIQERVRNNVSYDQTQKILLLTHHVPHKTFIPSGSEERDRQIILHDGNIRHLLTSNVVGCLSGSGGGSMTGYIGKHHTFCGVNAAFQGPSMVPNSLYHPDMVVSFPLDDYPSYPESQQKEKRISKSNILPFPKVVVRNAHTILQ